MEGAQHRLRGASQAGPVVHHRVEVHAHAGVLARGLDDEREGQVHRQRRPRAAPPRANGRRGDAAGARAAPWPWACAAPARARGRTSRCTARPSMSSRQGTTISPAAVGGHRLAEVDDEVRLHPAAACPRSPAGRPRRRAARRGCLPRESASESAEATRITSSRASLPGSSSRRSWSRLCRMTMCIRSGARGLARPPGRSQSDALARSVGSPKFPGVLPEGGIQEYGKGTMRIRDPIHGTIPVSDAEKAIIDSRHYQRLRHVRQLGFGDLAFPGATHTRHAHSLGAMHVASRLFDAVAAQRRPARGRPVALLHRGAAGGAVP